MIMTVKAIPDGFNTVTVFLALNQAEKFIDFANKILGATVDHITKDDEGNFWHGQITIGTSKVMIGNPMGQPETPANLYLYIDQPDEAFKKAVDAGCTTVMPMTDQFYGDRSGGVKDPFGNFWWFSKHIEDVAPDEMKKRIRAVAAEYKKKAA